MAEQPIIATTEGVGDKQPLIIIHGGAGKRIVAFTPEREAAAEAAIQKALEAGMAKLNAGEPAVEAVVAAVHVMEDAPEFNSGHGATLTSEGKAELDACIMRGDGSTGAVTGVTTVRNPIDAARAVMEQTGHVLFATPNQATLDEWGVAQEDPSYFVTPARLEQLARYQAMPDGGWKIPGHGTIGVVARDACGNIAAGTSTGGCCNQRPGRVGDTPICGAGTYANQQTVAISCTGTGEKFIQEVAGYQVHARVLWAGQTPEQALSAVLENVEDRGGDGGIICVPASGAGVIGWNACAQMDWGYAYGDVRVTHH